MSSIFEKHPDYPEADTAFREAASMLEELVYRDSRTEFAHMPATVYLDRSEVLHASNQTGSAVELMKKSISLMEYLIQEHNAEYLKQEPAICRVNYNKLLQKI